MTTDKPYWEQDIAECLRVAAEAIGPNSYYLRAAEYIDEMRDEVKALREQLAAAHRVSLEGNPVFQQLRLECESLRADRDALAKALRSVLEVFVKPYNETLWEVIEARQALSQHGGKHE